MNKKLLVILGPTATGKTSLAVRLARKFDGELISADSRQVYREMDIGTGKDLPGGAKLKKLPFSRDGYYLIGGIKVWGYDLVGPKQEYSVSKYQKTARSIINGIWKRKKLPILVGGTGLYIRSVISDFQDTQIPKNKELRKKIENSSVDELYEQLAKIDPMRAAEMNSSDSKNPRRLVRAIEVATWRIDHKGNKNKKSFFLKNLEILKIGISISQKELDQRIEKRVEERIKKGFSKEVEKILSYKISEEAQAMNTIGYKQWKNYLEGKTNKEEAISLWKKDEKKYSKRQTTWFKKEKNVFWFGFKDKDYPKSVEKLIESRWYNTH